MGLIKTLGRYAWRKYVTDGVFSSGYNKPDQIDIFPFVDAIDNTVTALSGGGELQGAWDASAGAFPGAGAATTGQSWIATTAGTVGGVAFRVGDRVIALTDNASTVTYAGNWQRLPSSVDPIVPAEATGGTANAIEATTSEAITGDASQVISILWAANNTGSATVRFNDEDPAYPIKTRAGADVQEDYLVAGNRDIGQIVGGNFQLLSEVGTAAAAAAAQAAADAAAASAASINLPSVAGHGGEILAAKEDESGQEYLPKPHVRGKVVITPLDYGVSYLDQDDDISDAINEAAGDFKADWYAANNAFKTDFDLAAGSWRFSNADLANIRQPGARVYNGKVASAVAGKPIFDNSGMNAPRFMDLEIQGRPDAVPTLGFLNSKADPDDVAPWTFPDSKQRKYFNVNFNGYFSQGCALDLAPEVGLWIGCTFQNKSRSLNAYSYINVSHAGTLDDYVGGVTSDYAHIPTAADGTQSNTIHQLIGCNFLRAADVNLSIVSVGEGTINSANGTLDVGSVALTAANVADNDKVFLYNLVSSGGGTWETLNGFVYTLKNVDTDAGTFDLWNEAGSAAINTSGLGELASGTVYNATGPVHLLNGMSGFHCTGSSYNYALGSPVAVLDLSRGGVVRQFDMDISGEAVLPSILKMNRGAVSQTIETLRLTILGANQKVRDAILDPEGAGTTTIKQAFIDTGSVSSAPTYGIIKNDSLVNIEDGRLVSIFADAVTGLASFTGDRVTLDGNTTPTDHYGHRRFQTQLSVGTMSSTGLTDGKAMATSSNAILDSSRTGTGGANHLRFFNGNGQVGSISTNASATTYSTSSDKRLKENWRDFDAGEILDALEVWKFDWKAGGSSYGVLAQDCKMVFPDAVVEGTGDVGDADFEPWSVDYSRFVPLLMSEVKSLRERMAAMEAK